MTNMGLRVAVVEDDAMMRLAISSALKLSGLEIAFESGSASEALAAARREIRPVDVAVLDLHLGDGPTGLDLAHALRRMDDLLGLVFLTSFEDPRLLYRTAPPAPAGAIHLLKGEIHLVQTLVDAVLRASEWRKTTDQITSGGRLSGLTDTQIEILKLVGAGMSNSEIARTRFMTEKSVEVAISRIAKALDIKFDSSTNQRVHIAKVYFRSIGKPLP